MPRCSSSSLRFRPITDSSPTGRPRGDAEARRLPRRVRKATARDGVPVRRNVTVVGTRDAMIASRDRTLPPNSPSRRSPSKTLRAASTLPVRGRGRSRRRGCRRSRRRPAPRPSRGRAPRRPRTRRRRRCGSPRRGGQGRRARAAVQRAPIKRSRPASFGGPARNAPRMPAPSTARVASTVAAPPSPCPTSRGPLSKTPSYLLFSDGYILSPKQFLYECWSAGYNAHIESSSFAERHEDTTLHVRQTGINVAMGRGANGRSSAGRARGGRRGMGGGIPVAKVRHKCLKRLNSEKTMKGNERSFTASPAFSRRPRRVDGRSCKFRFRR